MAGLKRLKEELRLRLGETRFRHAKGVALTAARLAHRHGISPHRAELAGWLHDCAKEKSRPELKRLLSLSKADPEERKSPALWHAAVGAYVARTDHGLKDREILGAIRFHTTAAPGMSPLQKLIFVADYIEPERPPWPELPKLRRLASKDLEAAYVEVLRHKLIDLLERGRSVHSRALAAWHEAIGRKKK